MRSASVGNRVQYRFFDKDFHHSSHAYVKRDEKELIRNCNAVTTAMQGSGIAVMRQIHSADALYVNTPSTPGSEYEVDALVTDVPGLVLGVQTADCVPVLFISDTIIAAAHAGWKGAKMGIIDNVINTMQDMGANKIVAVIGPSIQQRSYEVDLEYYKLFIEQDKTNARFFIPSTQRALENPHSPSHFMFDLPDYVKSKLQGAGIENIEHIDEDTYSNPQKYHSYRRSCHTDEPYEGNLLSAIMLK